MVDGIAGERLEQPVLDGQVCDWDDALDATVGALALAKENPESVAVFASAWASNEAAAVAAKLFDDLGIPAANRVIKSDRNKGLPADDVLHTDDHNPNRRGLRDLGFVGQVDELVDKARRGEIQTLLIWGGGLVNHVAAPEIPDVLAKVSNVIYLGVERDIAGDRARILMPVTSSWESAGSWTNIDGHKSAYGPTLKPVGKARAAITIWADLALRIGFSPLGHSVAQVAAQQGNPTVVKPLKPAGTLFRHSGLARRV